jgi:hypothetical protein
VQHGEKGPKTRLVWGYPLEMTILEAIFARPLIDHFSDGTESPMAIGKRRWKLGVGLLDIANTGVKHSLDFSKFDASVHPKLINLAFRILKTNFPNMSRDEEAAWDAIVNYFIHTTILMPDGNIYQKHSGIPSGSYFTQLVGSVVNFILINYITILQLGFVPSRGMLMVLGDDSVFSAPKALNLQQAAAEFERAFGMKLSVEKSIITFEPTPHFLGHYWKDGYVHKPLWECLRALCYHERYVPDLKTYRIQKLIAFSGEHPKMDYLCRRLLMELADPNYRGLILFTRVDGATRFFTGLSKLEGITKRLVNMDLSSTVLHRYLQTALL